MALPSISTGRPLRADLGLAALAAAAFTGLLLAFPATFLNGYDAVEMHLFYKEYFRQSVLAGEWPWWNPYTALGRPFFADVETACLYPPNWLTIPLGASGGIVAIVALHFWLAIAGMLRLALRLGAREWAAWTGALTFALAHAMLARLRSGQIEFFCGLAWLPLVFLLAVRAQDEGGIRRLAPLAGALALSFLAGSPPACWLIGLGLAIFLLARAESRVHLRSAGTVLIGGALFAAGLAAVQALPFLQLVREGNRPLASSDFAVRFGFEARSWLSLFLPGAGPFPADPETNAFIGAPLALAGIAGFAFVRRDRNLRALLALALIGAALAAGSHLPLLGWLARHAPGFGIWRLPGRYGSLVSVALILSGTLALSRASVSSLRAGRALAAAFVLAQGILLAAGLYFQTHLPPYRPVAWDADLSRDLAKHGLIAPDRPPPRVAFGESVLRANSGMVRGYATIGGFGNPMLARVWDYEHAAAGAPPSTFDFTRISPGVYDRGPFPLNTASIAAGWDIHAQKVLFRTPDPRAWLAYSTLRVAGRAGAREAVAAGSDLHRRPLVESAAFAVESAPDPADRGAVAIEHFSRNGLTLRVRAPVPALLVVSEAWYPGWTARVNGIARPVGPVNGWMRGVRVPAGSSEVALEFVSNAAPIALALSLATLGLCIVILLVF